MSTDYDPNWLPPDPDNLTREQALDRGIVIDLGREAAALGIERPLFDPPCLCSAYLWGRCVRPSLASIADGETAEERLLRVALALCVAFAWRGGARTVPVPITVAGGRGYEVVQATAAFEHDDVGEFVLLRGEGEEL